MELLSTSLPIDGRGQHHNVLFITVNTHCIYIAHLSLQKNKATAAYFSPNKPLCKLELQCLKTLKGRNIGHAVRAASERRKNPIFLTTKPSVRAPSLASFCFVIAVHLMATVSQICLLNKSLVSSSGA